MSSISSISLDRPASLVPLHVYSEVDHDAGLVGQMTERVQLVRSWGIQPGESVLEVGCGQGDTTVALAVAVGAEGRVVAVDPANPDYGSPKTVGQAWEFIRAGPLGGRVSFHTADAPSYVSSHADERFDVAILSQCSWYFSSPTSLAETLQTLGRVAKRVCISEWALSATAPTGHLHVLAALAQAALECRKPTSESNIRTVVAPAALVKLAQTVGLRLVHEETIVPPEAMYDGRWEVGAVRSGQFAQELEQYVTDEREKAVVVAMRDAVLKGREALLAKKEQISSMDVWVGVFERS